MTSDWSHRSTNHVTFSACDLALDIKKFMIFRSRRCKRCCMSLLFDWIVFETSSSLYIATIKLYASIWLKMLWQTLSWFFCVISSCFKHLMTWCLKFFESTSYLITWQIYCLEINMQSLLTNIHNFHIYRRINHRLRIRAFNTETRKRRTLRVFEVLIYKIFIE